MHIVTAFWCTFANLPAFYHQIFNCLVNDMEKLSIAKRPCTHPHLVNLYKTINNDTVACDQYNMPNLAPSWFKEPSPPMTVAPWFNNVNPTNARRIFIQRSLQKKRHWTNINDVVVDSRLRNVTIYRVETHPSAASVVSLFKDACMIVGYHGAGLANAVFASGPVCVLELSIYFSTLYRNTTWRANCKTIGKHPAVKKCQVIYLNPSALVNTNDNWDRVNWAEQDLDHHIKFLSNFEVPVEDKQRVLLALNQMEHECCPVSL